MNAHAGIILVLATFVILAVGSYFILPGSVAVHWNADGQADGYAGKLFGIGLFPLIGVAIYGILTLAPRLDPRKKNIQAFYPEYERFILVLEGFFLYIFILFIMWNMGMRFSFTNGIIPAFMVLMFYLGHLLERAKPNYFIGIRTPWTLENEKVWKETHTRTGKLLKMMAILPLIGLLSGHGQIGWMIIPLIGTMVYGAVLSYLLYRKYTRKNK